MNSLGIALIALLTQAPPAEQPRGSVEGIVAKLGTGEPAGGANIRLDPEKSPEGREFETYNTTTGADGKFIFASVAAGAYRLIATRSGYVPVEFGQRSPTSEGIPFNLNPGQKLTGIQLSLAPTGSISGHIYDRDGEPLGKAQVQALRMVYRDGRKTLAIVQSTQTDDRGEYRLFWLAPGRYYINAKPDMPEMAVDPASRSGATVAAAFITEPVRFGGYERASQPVVRKRTLSNGEVAEESYVPVYYPGVLEMEGASAIAVAAGATVTGVDLSIGSGLVRTRHIRGRVMDAATGQLVPNARIMAIPRNAGPLVSIPVDQTDFSGSFDLAGAASGSYFVVATNNRISGMTAVEVRNTDIQNIAILGVVGFKVPGRFVIDGRSSTSEMRVSDFRVARLVRDPDFLGMPSGGPTFNPPVLPDGSFTLEGVAAGDFRVAVRGLPPDGYVKSMRMGNSDVLESGLHIEGAPQSPLEIVIGLNAGRIEGTVVNTRQEPLPNRTVVLVPDLRHRQQSDLYKYVSSDASGRFQFEGIPPGDYALFAWENVESGAWQDAEFMSGFESRGKQVHISEGSRENIQLTVIP
jgi:hypothetical protein